MELPKRKKKSKPPQNQRSSSAAGSGVSLTSLWTITFAGIALLMAVGVGALLYIEQGRVNEHDRQLLDGQARYLGQHITQNLGMLRHTLTGLGSDTDLAKWFRGADTSGREVREQELARILPNAKRVRLLKPGHNTADLESDPPLSYASLLLLRAAEKKPEPPPLEMLQPGSPKAHLVGVTAVRGEEGEVLGLVHVAFDPALVRGLLEEPTAGTGRIELQQKVEGNSIILYATRGVSKVPGNPNGQQKIAGSQMTLAYWYGSGASMSGGLLTAAAIVLGLILLVGAAVAGLQYKRMRAALDTDQALVIGLAEDALAGHGFRRDKPRLQEFAPTLELLTARLKSLKEYAAEAKPEKRPSGSKAAPSVSAHKTIATSFEEVGDVALEIGDEAEEEDLTLAKLPKAIFQANDIRGPVGIVLSAEVVGDIGRAVGSQAYDQGQQSVIVARDARISGKVLTEALIEGLNATGRDVIDLGIVPVPVLYFATNFLGTDCGVMVTGSHSPPDWNGLKVVIGGEGLAGPALIGLGERVERGDLLEGSGTTGNQDLVPDYIERITADVSIARPLKVVIDCSCGCSALVAPRLFRALGCDLVELSCDFQEDQAPVSDACKAENFKALQEAVVQHQADIGMAFGDDGARLHVVDSGGHIVWPDRLLMLLSADVLSRHPGGDVVFDVMCTRALASQILQNGGRPVMWKSGHSSLKAKLRETGALLAGEWSGHIMFRERWYGFDDAMYAGARLLEILGFDPRSSEEVFADLPNYVSTPELLLPINEGEQYEVLDRALKRTALLGDAKLITIDGVRAEFEDGWGLIRASNTESALCFRFEADSEQSLERIQGLYRNLLDDVAPGLAPPF